MTRWAPSLDNCLEIARPIPEPPPVTMATFDFSLLFSSFSFIYLISTNKHDTNKMESTK